MQRNYSNWNNKKVSFVNEDLKRTSFIDSDLRGLDFSGADLSDTRFINIKTGITLINTYLFFLATIPLAVLSGFIATKAGSVLQTMLASQNMQSRIIGITTLVIIILFIVFAYLKGGAKAIKVMMIPVFLFSILLGGLSYFSGAGTGINMLYELLALLLVIIMFIVGTVARAVVGNWSNMLFVIIVLTGFLVNKSVGGGIGTIIMTISCAIISKRAMSGAKGFEALRKMASFFTVKFGTSFRNSRLIRADFSQVEKIYNCDFSNADLFLVHWGNCKKNNCIT